MVPPLLLPLLLLLLLVVVALLLPMVVVLPLPSLPPPLPPPLSMMLHEVGQHLRWRVCLFVCLVHGVPVVCGGRRLTKEGPYATRRQAEAVLFVRRKPTPPFAGCQGNLLFRGSRGLQTGRPVDHRPYSARHVGLLVESFWNNKSCAPVHTLQTPRGLNDIGPLRGEFSSKQGRVLCGWGAFG